MNIILGAELEEFVHLKMETGRYASAGDVVREALRMMDERDQLAALDRDAIRMKIAEGMNSLRAGDGADGETFLAAMDAELAELERRRS